MPPQPNQKLLPSMRANLRLRHFSPRTEEAYVGWVRRFVKFHHLEHPDRMGEAEVTAFVRRPLEIGSVIPRPRAGLALAVGLSGESPVHRANRRPAPAPSSPRVGGAAGSVGSRNSERNQQAGDLSQLQAFVRDAPARGGL